MLPLPALQKSETLKNAAGAAAFSLDHRVCKDIDEQSGSISGWQQTYEQVSSGTFFGHTTELCFDGIQLFRETTHQQVYQTGSPRPGCYVLAVPVAMQGRAVLLGQPLQRDRLMVLQENDPLDFCAPRHFDVVALVLPAELLRQFAAQIAGFDLVETLQGSAVRSPQATVINTWRYSLLSMLDSIQAAPQRLSHANLRHALAQELLWNLLSVVESLNSAADLPLLPLSRRQLVEQAKAYLREHVEEPVTIAELCVALNVSRRTLQYSFQDVLDINPVRYLKVMRLNGVRRELRASHPVQATVGDIAARWGFWHLSRFAADYRRMFGELPSVTLHQMTV